ncbi:MAG: MYG1 family protein [Candidatus Paceibacterota bacterium]|jgi:uncharacterized UPF0160 family protein
MKYKIVTHSGTFHPDDVFAVATLELALGEAEIVRTRDSKKISEGDFIIDVGGQNDGEKNFDHHQEGGAGERPNGVPYASFGLVWKKFGAKLCAENEKVAEKIDKTLVEPLDLSDNGKGELKPLFGDVYPNTLFHIIYSQNPTWKEENIDRDKIFLETVLSAKKILLREIKVATDELEGALKVEEAYQNASDKRIIILDGNYPWIETLSKYPEPLFAIEPSKDKTAWEVESVKSNLFSFNIRQSFPKDWAGKRSEELQKISGVSDAIFCHNGLFFAAAKSKESAIELAMIAIKN